MPDDPKQPLPGAPENPEEGLSFPGEDADATDKAIIDDTADPSLHNEIERDDDAPLSDPKPT
jgi:hypothetical protein